MGDDGFFDDRIIKTRDRFTELQIKKQKKKPTAYDLEYDDGSDLPEWSNKVLIEVANDDPAPEPVVISRPKLEAKRTLESRKSKQRREVIEELNEIKEREREIEDQKKRARELQFQKEEEALRKEKDEI